MTLIDDDKIEDKEAVQERRAMPGETLDRDGVSWVKNYDKKMNEEELEWSRRIRREFKQKFVDGEYPHSWWPDINAADKRRKYLDQIANDEIASGRYDDTWSVRDFHDNPALSQFPSKLAEQILKCWSWKNDNVFDPFAGHLSRPLLTNHFNRNYWGCDISREYFDKTRNEILDRVKGGLLDDPVHKNEKELIDADLRGNRVRVERRDSRHLDDIPDKWADFCYTSPPYFDVEFYGDEDQQLGNANEEYQDFLDDIEQVLGHVHRILKPHTYAAFVVNDFRQDSGVNGLYPWHADLIKRGQAAGFQLHDIAMYPTGRSAALFAEQQVWMESTAKVHEYIIVFRRWHDDWTPDSNEKWPVRGLWWDVYPSEKLIAYYGVDGFTDWLQRRQERDLPIDRWVDEETGDVQFENHPKHRDTVSEYEGLNVGDALQ